MPLNKDEMREYQRKRRELQKGRADFQAKTAHLTDDEFAAEARDQVAAVRSGQVAGFLKDPAFREETRQALRELEEGKGVPLTDYHEHYWRRRAGESTATCIEFEYQGRRIGGCGEVRPYAGKLLPSFDGETPFISTFSNRLLERINAKKKE